ncbi:glycosyltransferase [Candidatus Gracilibacteria bacterium]|nr:glycosyltransferase [Candidatus Gracilibacteria bacterium]MCF7819368.1 glycosyltransferase [Candidatus Gracilibacteria bacterium]
MNHPSFSVILPSHNEGEWLEKTVRSVLEETDYSDFEIIVVSDGSTDSSTDFLKQKKVPNTKLLELSRPMGAAQARNAGGEKARGDLLVFLDAHMKVIDSSWLKHLAMLLRDPSVGGASLAIAHLEDPEKVGFIYTIKDLALEPTWIIPEKKNISQKVPALSGACFGIRKEIFDQTGGFDEGLRKWGREDFEYSLRLWRLGYDLLLDPTVGVAHSWARKRTFPISWNEVDYNILRTSATLFSPEYHQKVVNFLRSQRSGNVLRIVRELEKDIFFQKRYSDLQSQYDRSFEEYRDYFFDLLPFTKG